MGTPQYMAPEQIEHPLQVDHRADIYSLGVVFYQMLTGELPIGRFAPPSKKVQIDVRLDEVVLRALEKEPERRYQQASEIKTQVETIATSPPAVPEQTQDRSQRWRLPPLVVRRDGQRAINWPVLAVRGLVGLFAVFMTALLLFVAMLPFHSMHGGDLVLYTTPATCLIAGIGVLCVAMAIRVLRGFEVPLDQLPESMGRPVVQLVQSPAQRLYQPTMSSSRPGNRSKVRPSGCWSRASSIGPCRSR